MRTILLFILTIGVFGFSYAKSEVLVSYQFISVNDGEKQVEKKASKKHKRFNLKVINLKNRLKRPLHLWQTKKRTKAGAVLMAVLTGPLGGHRLYLGTQPYVPIVYTLTLGGGMGLLPVLDIVAILTTKDLSKYEDCSQIIMWVN